MTEREPGGVPDTTIRTGSHPSGLPTAAQYDGPGRRPRPTLVQSAGGPERDRAGERRAPRPDLSPRLTRGLVFAAYARFDA